MYKIFKLVIRRIIIAIIVITPLCVIADDKLEGPAPDFTLKSNSGTNIKLSELRGDVVMINFWASWCAPCRQEMPLLDKISDRYKDLGFTLLGINIEEEPDRAKAMLSEIPVNFPILFDTQNKVSQQYNLIAMPSSVFVDRDGKIRYFHAGYLPGDEKEYEKFIKNLVRE